MSDTDIGLLSGSQTITGFVGSDAPLDFYKFNINTPGSFSLSLEEIGGNADVLILDKNGIILYSPTASDATSEAINIDKLVAGDYQIQVLAKGSDTDYTLSLKIDELTGITPEDAIAPGGSGIELDSITNSADIRSSVADTTQQPDEIIGSPELFSLDGNTSNENQTLGTEEETQPLPEKLSPDGGDTSNENQALGTEEEEAQPLPEPQLDRETPSSGDLQPPPFPNPFTSGTFTVDETGLVKIDYVFDGGGYKGQLAIFSLDSMEQFEPGSYEFIQEAARRALSNSVFGNIIIADATEGANFSGQLGEADWNTGEYQGIKTFAMRPGDEFGMMLVPNGTAQQVFDNPAAQGALRPLFSLVTANPLEGFHLGQIADVAGDGHTFVMEDLRVDNWTDRDYNDIIFRVEGATGKAVSLDEVIDPRKDWRGSELGQKVISYVAPEQTQPETGGDIQHVKPDIPISDYSDPDELELFGNQNVVPDAQDEVLSDNNSSASPDSAPVNQTPVESALPLASGEIENSDAQQASANTQVISPEVANTNTTNAPVTAATAPASPAPTLSNSIPAASDAIENSDTQQASANTQVISPEVANTNTTNAPVAAATAPASPVLANSSTQNPPVAAATAPASPAPNLSNSLPAASGTVENSDTQQASANTQAISPALANSSTQNPPVAAATAPASPVLANSSTQNPPVAAATAPASQTPTLGNSSLSTTVEIQVGNGNSVGSGASSPTLAWMRQMGTSASDRARGLTVDSAGNIYVAGATDAALDGYTNTSGNPDPFITKYDANGNKLWTRQTGSSIWDFHTSIAIDSNGNLYTSEYEHTDWDNRIAIAKWTNSGDKIWSQFISTGNDEWASDVTVDSSGNVYITGHTQNSLSGSNAGQADAFVAKYDAYGNQSWIKQLGTWGQERGRSVATDSAGNVYIAGLTEGYLDGQYNAGGTDVFVTKYDAWGNKLWTRLSGTPASEGNASFEFTGTEERNVGIAVDSSGNIYVSGRTEGRLDGNVNAGGSDVFLTKYSPSGSKLWTRQFGGTGNEYSTGVSIDSTGKIFISGVTSGSFDGQANLGQYDAFITQFDSNGNKLATKFLGTTAEDVARDIAVDKQGNAIIAGYTKGSLAGNANAGDIDVFVAKYAPTQPNRAPVVNVTNSNQTVIGKHSITPSFSVTDADIDPITRYRFWDGNNSSTSGYFTVNGVQQTANQTIEVTADQLTGVKFVGGTAAGNDNVYVQAYDGKDWSNWTGFNVQTTKANTAPAVSANNQTVNANQAIAPTFSPTDADGDPVTRYRFWDGNSSSTSGYFTINGIKQAANQSIEVTAAQLGSVRFVGGTAAGSDNVYIQAYDGYDWGNWMSFNIATQKTNSAPVVNPANQTVYTKHAIAPSVSATDADGDAITGYYFYDGNTNTNSGYFTLNGVQQAAGTSFYVAANQLSTLKFVAGSVAGNENLLAMASDGKSWGNWTNLNIQTQLNPVPVVTASNQTVKGGQPMMPYFTTSDANNDTITQYAFYDSNTSSTSGYFTVNGVKQAAGQVFSVAANQLNTVRFVGGSVAGSDGVYVQAYDGYDWGAWTNFSIATSVGSKPVVNANNQTVELNQTITPLFSATDADNNAIAQYAFYDGNTSSTSGYFTVNGVKQAAGQTFTVAANQLSTVRFVGGSVAGDDNVSIAATDGVDGWSNWKSFTITTKATAQDWFDINIKDAGIRSVARSRFIDDNSYSRDDMLKIFQEAGDGGVVDATEYADLKKLVTDTAYIKMPDYVRVLSQKIAISNPANKSYQGSYLGDLLANDSSLKSDKLLNKWFLGGDLPIAEGQFAYSNGQPQVTYRYVQGSLFQNGITYQDVRQGGVGDCYYMAGLAVTALRTPTAIENMFIDNKDNSYTVRFFNNGTADYVTVNRQLPTYTSNGWLPFAQVGGYYTDSANELWVALAEKAYAQMNEAGWLERGKDKDGNILDGFNTYKSIEGGWMPTAIKQITNRFGNGYYLNSASDAVNAFKSGQLVTFASKNINQVYGTNIVSSHAYAMVGYNDATQKFTLYNPWGVDGGKESGDPTTPKALFLELTWSQLQAYFQLWASNN